MSATKGLAKQLKTWSAAEVERYRAQLRIDLERERNPMKRSSIATQLAMIAQAVKPRTGDTVCWQSPFDGWRTGTYVGLAPGDSGQGDPFVAVDSHNGRVHVRLSSLSR